MNIETFGANEIENMQESLFKDIELNEAVSPPLHRSTIEN